MIDFRQFREFVVIPALQHLSSQIPYSEEAVDLLMMTAAHESIGGRYLRQVGMHGTNGAFGPYQMELATHDDIHLNFLDFREELDSLVEVLPTYHGNYRPDGVNLMTNFWYATVMARVHYYRVPEAIPVITLGPSCDKKQQETLYLEALSRYAKKYYNTKGGKATSTDYYNDYLWWKR